MLIESLIQRAKGTHVTLGDDVYHFFTHIKGDTRHVCEVEDEDHIQTFLAVKEGFRLVKQPKKPAITPAPVETDTDKEPGEATTSEVVKKSAKAK